MQTGKRFKFQAFTSTISCTLVLILIGLMVLSVLIAGNVSNSIRQNFIVTLTLGGSNDAVLGTDEGMGAQTAAMQQSLEQEPYVREQHLITATEVLQQQMAVIGGNPEEFLGFNPYYSEIEIDLRPEYVQHDSLSKISKEITTKYPLVSEVSYERELMDNLNSNMHKLTFVLMTVTILLIVILFALINNMVRLSVYARRFHIRTMKLVGASYWFVRRPFMARSLWIGLVSGVLANGVLIGVAQWVTGYDEFFSDCLSASDILLMAFIVMLTGLVLLALCTFLSVNHFLKIKEHQIYR